jgi:lipopolysaccharide export system permease protein
MILDKYLIKKYLGTFFFVLGIFSLIVIAIDFSEKVEDFIEQPCTKWQVLTQYYPGFLLHMAGLLFPMYALISVVFFTSRLAYDSEIMAILNAGVSFRRLLRPYLLAGGFLCGLHLTFGHFLIPMMNKVRLKFEHTYICRDKANCDDVKTSNLNLFIGPETKVFMKYYQREDSSARDFRLEQFQNNRVVSILDAKQAVWLSKEQKWRLSFWMRRDFDGIREKLTSSNSQPIDTILSLRPTDLVRYKNANELHTTPELNAVIDRDRKRGLANKQFEIEKYRRTAESITVLILTIIGVAVASRKVRGGMGLHLAVGIGIGALFILLSKFAVSFAASGSVSPLIGMWIPNMIFAVVAIWLVARAQK